MRILILSCNTGEGHNSCASALKELFDSKGHYCVTEEALSFISPAAARLISRGHTLIYRYFPGLFRWGYGFAERHPAAYRSGSALNRFFCSGRQRLAEYIDSRDFDAVICTHTFAGIMLTGAKQLCRTDFTTAFVGTDYTCSPTTEAGDFDVYFIPDDTLAKEYTDYGIPASKLVPSGIPIRQMFYTDMEKAAAKAAEGVDREHKHLLVMGGSMGCGRLDKLIFLLANSLRPDEEITVICGTNKRMQKKLSRRYRRAPNIHIRGYVSDVPCLMDSADLYLTKPGGISVTEAKHKHLPMICLNTVAGCEAYNCRFFVEKGCAVSENNIAALSRQCLSLLRGDEERMKLEAHYAALADRNSAQIIYDYLTSKVLFASSF